MTYEPPPDILDRATVALHDAHCPDRTCEPHTMGAYRTQARAVLVAVSPSIAAGAWDEGFKRRDSHDGPIEMVGTPLRVTIPPNPYRGGVIEPHGVREVALQLRRDAAYHEAHEADPADIRTASGWINADNYAHDVLALLDSQEPSQAREKASECPSSCQVAPGDPSGTNGPHRGTHETEEGS